MGKSLFNEQFSVRIGNSLDNLKPISSGVPQESVLQPLLLLLCMADLPVNISSSCCVHVDDLKIYGCITQQHQILQKDLNQIYLWNYKPLNINTCTLVQFVEKQTGFFSF